MSVKTIEEATRMETERILQQMTVEEKAALVSGTNFMYTNPIPRLSIPSLRMSDGPHGLRLQKEGGDNGVSESEPATSRWKQWYLSMLPCVAASMVWILPSLPKLLITLKMKLATTFRP